VAERTWTVAEIGRRIEQVVADRMSAAFWVRGELADVRTSASGTLFFTLVQTDAAGRVLARLGGTGSPGKARLVDRKMRRVGQPLAEGIEVRVRGHLDWYTAGGRLGLALLDVDPAHTAGAMALARRELLAALAAEGLVDANAARPLPRPPLRLGLVTRRDSQAYHDLVDELRRSGLPFHLVLASVGVQGAAAGEGLAAAVGAVAAQAVDLVLVTRGGGAEVDLATFDHPGLARAVAGCDVQVWTGIGHHLDTPVCEQVAARAFKTPTALAQGVVAEVRDAVASVEAAWAGIRLRSSAHVARAGGRLATAGRRTAAARVALRGAAGRLDADAVRLAAAARRGTSARLAVLDARDAALSRGATAVLSDAARRLDAAGARVATADPARLLARGWSVTTTADGALVTAPVPAGTRLTTRVRDGVVDSEVVRRAGDAARGSAEVGR
jgi:exodeoxyribonuclease VII large subunit